MRFAKYTGSGNPNIDTGRIKAVRLFFGSIQRGCANKESLTHTLAECIPFDVTLFHKNDT